MKKYKCSLPDVCSIEKDEICCYSCGNKEFCSDACASCEETECGYRTPEKIKQLPKAKAVCFTAIILLAALLLVNYSIMLYEIYQLEDEVSDVHAITLLNNKKIDGLSKKIGVMGQSVQTAEKVRVKSLYRLSEGDRRYIEGVVMSESGNQPFSGQRAVAQTIYCRAFLWHMTPMEVVTEIGQYAKPYNGQVNPNVKQAVTDIFDNGYMQFQDPVTHFHTVALLPYWTKYKVMRGVIRSHKFWY